MEVDVVVGVFCVLFVLLLGVEGFMIWFLIVMIYLCCSSLIVVVFFFELCMKYFFKKLIFCGLSWFDVGSCGGFFWVMLYMMVYLLLRLV